MVNSTAFNKFFFDYIKTIDQVQDEQKNYFLPEKNNLDIVDDPDDLTVYNDCIIEGIDVDVIKNSLEKISNFYLLYKYWHMLVNNPELYIKINKNYHDMFGKHIAHFNYFGLSKNYISSNNQNLSYHRFNINGTIHKLIFNDFNHKNNKNKVYLGIVKSLWQGYIDSWLHDSCMNNQLMNEYQTYIRKLEDNNVLEIYFRKNDFSTLLDIYRVSYGDFLSNNIILKLKRFIKLNPKHINFIHLKSLLKMLDILFRENSYNQTLSISYSEIENATSRLNFFLHVLFYFGLNYHRKFVVIFELIIHELSLIIFLLNQRNDNLVITYDMLLDNTKKEFFRSNNSIKNFNNIDLFFFPANSGMHAHTISIIILQYLLEINSENIDNFCANIVGDYSHYFECNYIRNEIIKIKFNFNHSIENCQIHFINDSFINRQNYIQPIDISTYIKKLNYNHHNVLIIDRTANLGESLNLSYEINRLINDNKLTVIIWESWQKFGLLGTDQAQYGRSVVISSKLMIDKLSNLVPDIKKDMGNLDYQIAGLFQLARDTSLDYKNICYKNAKKLRFILGMDVEQDGPFINNRELENVLRFFGSFIMIKRESFGFNYTTFIGNRISVGAEPDFDIAVLGNALVIIKDKIIDNCEQSINNIFNYIQKYFDSFVLGIEIFNNYDNILDLFVHIFILRFILIYDKYRSGLKINVLNTLKIQQIFDYILKMDSTNYSKLLDYLDNSRTPITMLVDIKKTLKNLNI